MSYSVTEDYLNRLSLSRDINERNHYRDMYDYYYKLINDSGLKEEQVRDALRIVLKKDSEKTPDERYQEFKNTLIYFFLKSKHLNEGNPSYSLEKNYISQILDRYKNDEMKMMMRLVEKENKENKELILNQVIPSKIESAIRIAIYDEPHWITDSGSNIDFIESKLQTLSIMSEEKIKTPEIMDTLFQLRTEKEEIKNKLMEKTKDKLDEILSPEEKEIWETISDKDKMIEQAVNNYLERKGRIPTGGKRRNRRNKTKKYRKNNYKKTISNKKKRTKRVKKIKCKSRKSKK